MEKLKCGWVSSKLINFINAVETSNSILSKLIKFNLIKTHQIQSYQNSSNSILSKLIKFNIIKSCQILSKLIKYNKNMTNILKTDKISS